MRKKTIFPPPSLVQARPPPTCQQREGCLGVSHVTFCPFPLFSRSRRHRWERAYDSLTLRGGAIIWTKNGGLHKGGGRYSASWLQPISSGWGSSPPDGIVTHLTTSLLVPLPPTQQPDYVSAAASSFATQSFSSSSLNATIPTGLQSQQLAKTDPPPPPDLRTPPMFTHHR